MLWNWTRASLDLPTIERGGTWIDIYQERILTAKQNQFKELSSTAVLPFNEPVEAIDYDVIKSRLVLSSHGGQIKLFRVEKNGMKTSLYYVHLFDWMIQGHCSRYGARTGMRSSRPKE